MTKNKLYQLLNQTQMPLSDYPQDDLSDDQKDQLYAQFKASIGSQKSKVPQLILGLGLVAALALAVLSPWGQQASASVKSLIDTSHFSLSASQGNLDGQTYPVGQLIDMGDHRVKLEDALLDEESVTASFLVESPQALTVEDTYDFVGMAIAVNGETTRISSAAGSSRLLPNGLYQMTMTYRFDKPLQLQADNQIYLQISGLVKNIQEVISMTDAAFDLSGRPEDLNGGSRYINLDHSAPKDPDQVQIQALKLHPLKTQIQALIPEKDAQNSLIEADLILPDGRRQSLTGASDMIPSTSPGMVAFHSNFDFSSATSDDLTYEDLLQQESLQVQLFKIPLPESSGKMDASQRHTLGEPVTLDLDKKD
ncbi:hypothetical protein [Aerococcus sp. HMSC06H08]|uniref:hypothetical protein n=1 Tax=Aerococcus sp. HMSC06H08 TaxID=1581129 RepID=UPI0008A3530E|nr:hypothetical protein [Aerococcus sp. HMSC06H08]OFT40611.1 hypothetical protein HMPREF3161_05105 [Aerococcus sp. HMSC06H08]